MLQIDPEYLSALPPGMRKEILDAYSIPSITQPLTSRKSSKAAVRTGAASKSTSRRKATTLLQPPPSNYSIFYVHRQHFAM